MDLDAIVPVVSEYEQQREARIAANRRRLEALGVLEAAHGLRRTEKPKKSRCKIAPDLTVATRASKRIRGQAADAVPGDQDMSEEDEQTAHTRKSSSKTQSDHNAPRFELSAAVYAAPFTIMSIGVTVWDLGQIYRGPFSSNYYSSRGCLYRHAYPVGYRASKEVFGHTWDMSISAGDAGPVFTVSQRGGSRCFKGPTPTRPWSDACLAVRPSQRISGPLFFGFSDIHVQRALAALYTPAELAYALYGTPMCSAVAPAGLQQPSANLQQLCVEQAAAEGTEEPGHRLCVSTDASNSSSDTGDMLPTVAEPQQQQQQQQQQQEALARAEAFALELQSIKGLGGATAQALALTCALGGSRHHSLKGLCNWLAAAPEHPTQLRHFLLNSEEVPRCSRQLPSWRDKWVPGIVQQLTQLQQ